MQQPVQQQVELEEVVAELEVPVMEVDQGAGVDQGIIDSLRSLPWSQARDMNYHDLINMCDYAAQILNN